MAKGDVVLITFPFTDLSGSKLRPAVVIADNSLKKQSLVKPRKIATLAKGLLGRLTSNELADLDNKLKILLRLP